MEQGFVELNKEDAAHIHASLGLITPRFKYIAFFLKKKGVHIWTVDSTSYHSTSSFTI
jgi:hypothetical protein